jgi:nucleoside phosphorylase
VNRLGAILTTGWIAISLAGCSATRAFMAETETLTEAVDVAVITVLPEEYHAVLRKLENVRRVIEPDGRPNVYVWATAEMQSSDRKAPRRFVVAMAGEAGEVSGALVTKATIDRWRPRDVLLVGIAGGVHESVALGDVVISSQIWGYEHGHLGRRYDSGGVLFFQPEPTLLKAALDLGPDWRRRIDVSRPDGNAQSKVLVGKTASGNKVIETASSAYFAESLRLDESIVSVDMEGAGAAAAVGRDHDMGGTTGFLMIRGISDLIDKKERARTTPAERGRNPQRDRWKRYAADVAASFAVGLMELKWSE